MRSTVKILDKNLFGDKNIREITLGEGDKKIIFYQLGFLGDYFQKDFIEKFFNSSNGVFLNENGFIYSEKIGIEFSNGNGFKDYLDSNIYIYLESQKQKLKVKTESDILKSYIYDLNIYLEKLGKPFKIMEIYFYDILNVNARNIKNLEDFLEFLLDQYK